MYKRRIYHEQLIALYSLHYLNVWSAKTPCLLGAVAWPLFQGPTTSPKERLQIPRPKIQKKQKKVRYFLLGSRRLRGKRLVLRLPPNKGPVSTNCATNGKAYWAAKQIVFVGTGYKHYLFGSDITFNVCEVLSWCTGMITKEQMVVKTFEKLAFFDFASNTLAQKCRTISCRLETENLCYFINVGNSLGGARFSHLCLV